MGMQVPPFSADVERPATERRAALRGLVLLWAKFNCPRKDAGRGEDSRASWDKYQIHDVVHEMA